MRLFDSLHGSAAFVATALALTALGTPAKAAVNLVTNGSFDSCASAGVAVACSASELVNNTNLYGWTTTSNYSFLVLPGQATVDVGNGIKMWAFPSTSPDGGNFLLQDGGYLVGTLTQTITGLIVGTTYNVGFFQAAAQQSGYSGATTDYWQVSFGGVTKNSDLMSDATQSYVGWMAQSLSFVATATSQVLGFMAVGTPAGQPPFAGLDGVSVTIPEPASLALLGCGLLGLALVRRRPGG